MMILCSLLMLVTVCLEDAARTCLALFVGLEPSAALELPTGEVLSYEQWRKQRIARAAAVLKDND